MKTNTSLVGSLPDVCISNEVAILAYVTGTEFRVTEFNLNSAAFTGLFNRPEQGIGFARTRNVGGNIWVAWRWGNGQVITVMNLNTGVELNYGGTFYNWPFAFGLNGFAMNDSGNNQLRMYNYNHQLIKTQAAFPVTGIAYIQDDNTIVSWNDNRGTKLQYNLYNPQYTDDWSAFSGEGASGGAPLVINHVLKLVAFEGQNTYSPHVARYGDKYIIATGDYGIRQIKLAYDIEGGIPDTGYNPKNDLIVIRTQLDAVIAKL